MKSIFQNGLALGIPTKNCQCINMNFSWLFSNPTNLLWMDKLIVTEGMWKLIMSDSGVVEYMEKSKQQPYSKAVKLVYNILNDVGLVNIIPDDSITQEQAALIDEQICDDLEMLEDYIKEDSDTMIKIANHCYCIPSLWSLYAALYLSQANNASFMLATHELDYLKLLLPLKLNRSVPIASRTSAINEILNIKLPHLELGHNYLFDTTEHCRICERESLCKDSYLTDIEKQTFNILKYCEHEEISQLCELMDRICSEKFKTEFDVSPCDLLHEINIEKVKVQRKLNKTYRSIEKWNTIVMTISASMTLGAFFSHPTLAAIGASGVLTANVIGTIKNYNEKKYKWVNLFNKEEV